MGKALRFGVYLTIIFFVIAAVMMATFREMDLMYLINYLIVGIPALVGYFVFTVLYYTTKPKVFRLIVGIVCVLLAGWLFYEFVYWPYKYL